MIAATLGPLARGFDDLEGGARARILELVELSAAAPPEKHGELQAAIERELLLGSLSRMAMATSDGFWRPFAHSVLLNIYLTRAMRREIDRLLITMPPQHGKSITTSKHFPASYLRRYPNHRVILTSYEADFAAGWGGDVRGLIDDNVDLLGLEVRQSSRAKKRWDLVGCSGGMMTAGMGGPVTGKGANVLVIDDPVKNDVEAASPAIQERNWAWWEKVAYSRLRHDDELDDPADERAVNGKPIVVVIQTRWHEADLAGKLLEEEGDVANGGRWTVLNLPALAEDDDPLGRARDEALCPELHPQAELEETRRVRGAAAWSSIWQQRPAPEGGGRFQKERFRYWSTAHADTAYYSVVGPLGDELVAKADCWRFTTVDTAATTKSRSDYTVVSVWDVAPPLRDAQGRDRPALLILVHRERVRVETADHLALLHQVNDAWSPLWHGVEKASYGLTLIQSAIRAGMRIRELPAERDKWARSEIASVMVNNGRVFFPANATWLDVWEHELLMFPNGVHDDQVDTLSYAALVVDEMPGKRRDHSKHQKSFRERVLQKHKKRVHPVLGRI